jgi:hypothetical protein
MKTIVQIYAISVYTSMAYEHCAFGEVLDESLKTTLRVSLGSTSRAESAIWPSSRGQSVNDSFLAELIGSMREFIARKELHDRTPALCRIGVLLEKVAQEAQLRW